jgi:Ca-activated chloride channel family protein
VGISFLEGRFLLLLLGVPVLLLLFLLLRIQRRMLLKRLVRPRLLGTLLARPPGWAVLGAPMLSVGAMGFLLVALARPQTGATSVTIRAREMDIILAVDLSSSMMAPDAPPTRLATAKRSGLALLELLSGERVGVLGFSGDAFLACPLTNDYASVRMFLDALDPTFLSQPGTSLAKAVAVAAASFPEDAEGARVLVIVSDGEDHVGGVEQAAREARTHAMRIFCLGVGTPEGELIPVDSESNDYKRDSEGRPVLSRLNEESLLRLAVGTEGTYYRLRKGEPEMEAIYGHLRAIPAPVTKRKLEVTGAERFQYPLGAAGLLLVAAMALQAVREREPPRRRRWGAAGGGGGGERRSGGGKS